MSNDGRHLFVDATACKNLSNRSAAEAFLREAVGIAGMNILGMVSYDLRADAGREPGVSVVALLAESHASIHTFPESGVVTLDMYSCRPFETAEVLHTATLYFGITSFLTNRTVQRWGLDVDDETADVGITPTSAV